MSELIDKIFDRLEEMGTPFVVNLNVHVGKDIEIDDGEEPGVEPTPEPEEWAYRYRVVASDKPSKRAKVRASANAGVGEVDYVYNNDVVGTDDDRVVNGMIYVEARLEGHTELPLIKGFVEEEYLRKL